MSAGSTGAEVRALLRAGRLEEAAHGIVCLAERAENDDEWPLIQELCEAVAVRVCDRRRVAWFQDDAAAAAILEVVGHVYSNGWNDADSLLECAERAASRHVAAQVRYRSRWIAPSAPMEESDQEAGVDADALGGDLARLWNLALARLEVVHPNHARHVRGRVAEERLPESHAMDSLRAVFVQVLDNEERGKVEEAQAGLLAR